MIKIIHKGKLHYQDSIQEMEELVVKITSNQVEEEIWIVEYDNLYTVGNSESSYSTNIIHSAPLFKTNRGGKITFHGDGQIIIYFMINLKKLFYPKLPDVSKFVWLLEQITIDSLKEIELTTHRLKINHGVWIENRKITAIGLRIKRWISSHGIAINFDTDLKFYDYITPCGLEKHYSVTSILKENPNLNITKKEFIDILIRNTHIYLNLNNCNSNFTDYAIFQEPNQSYTL